jgi:hypothetical protein
MAKPKVVAAVGAASGSLSPNGRKAARLIELAMADAVKDCVEEGVSLSDTETIKARMMAARERVKSLLWPTPGA